MVEETKRGPGRPPRSVPPRTIVMKVDHATYRMIEALASYGRFGDSPPAVALFIIRTWIFENEARLKSAIDAGEVLLGHLYPESEPDE
jgi:hypothetical protein